MHGPRFETRASRTHTSDVLPLEPVPAFHSSLACFAVSLVTVLTAKHGLLLVAPPQRPASRAAYC
jgi:hypothetical protein